MSSIMSEIRLVIPKSVWTKVAQSINRHKLSDEFDNERICPVTRKLFALELLKIAVLNLVRSVETTFLNQSWPKIAQSIYRHKISDEFDNEGNPPSYTEVICPWIIENCCLCMYIHHLSLLYIYWLILI